MLTNKNRKEVKFYVIYSIYSFYDPSKNFCIFLNKSHFWKKSSSFSAVCLHFSAQVSTQALKASGGEVGHKSMQDEIDPPGQPLGVGPGGAGPG